MAEAYILFELAGSTYGIPSAEVLHVEMIEHVTPVPNAAPALDGVVFSRGQVVPALNLRVRFGLPREANTARTRLVVTRLHARTVGLVVDAAREFRAIATETIKPLTETLHGVRGNYVRGVATVNGRLVLLLDLSAVLDPAEIPAADAALSTTS